MKNNELAENGTQNVLIINITNNKIEKETKLIIKKKDNVMCHTG